MFLHELPPFLHALNFLHVSVLLSLSLFPLLVRNFGHNFHIFLSLLLILILFLFLVVLYFLVDQLLPLFDEADFKPFLEHLVGLLLLDLLFKSFFLFLSKLLLSLECLLHKLLFFPFVHSSGSLLVLLVLFSLLLH